MHRHSSLAFAVCVLAALGAAGTGLATAQQPPDAPSVQRLWVEELAATRSPQAYVEISVSTEFALPASVLWKGVIVAAEPFDHVIARATVNAPDGTPLNVGQVELDIGVGENPFSLAWNPEGLEDGVYRAELEVTRAGDMVLASKEYRIRQISGSNLNGLLQTLEQELSVLNGHLAQHPSAPPPYAAMRLAIVRDYLPITRQAFEDGSWRRAQDDAEFFQELLASVRVGLSFREPNMDEGELPAIPAIRRIRVADGGFVSDGRPVFLLGATASAEELSGAIPALRRYGLNLVETGVGPADTLDSPTSTGAFPKSLGELLAQSEAANMGVTVNLEPDEMTPWAYDAWPAMAEHHTGTFPYDMTHPKVQAILERHIQTVVSGLRDRESVVSVAVADRPEMQFTGEPVRQGLIAFAKEQYGDRETMNRIWGTFYLDFNEVDLTWDMQRSAYRHDLALYQHALGTVFLSGLADLARQNAPGVPVQVNYSDRAFQPGESAFGVDREAVARQTDISGCVAGQLLNNPILVLGYPSQSLNYTLLRSFDPSGPVFNSEDSFIPDVAAPAKALGNAAHALVWEGAMAGLNASTAPLGRPDGNPQTLLGRPQRLEGYARACLDLNRLAPLVTAFQKAPCTVSIVWSMSSKIYNDGDPYLESVMRAYDGCHTFGFKVGFITEEECEGGALNDVQILVIPDVVSMSDKAFEAVDAFIGSGGITIRHGKPIPYNPRGLARQDTLTTSSQTILLRGKDSPTSYLHALDAACALDNAPSVPRPINLSRYPLEGVKTRFVEHDGEAYLYAIDLRKTPETVYLEGPYSSGTDLIGGNHVTFPTTLNPAEPMLIRLDRLPVDEEDAAAAEDAVTDDVPLGIVEPVPQDMPEERPAQRPHRRHATR